MTTLAPHLQRVVDEKNELSERLRKLHSFFQTPFFAGLDAAERSRLRNQARFMDGYLAVLEERIAASGCSDMDEMVSRFLTWPVPADVYPDGQPGEPGRTGTNLLTAPQAKAMLQHVLGG